MFRMLLQITANDLQWLRWVLRGKGTLHLDLEPLSMVMCLSLALEQSEVGERFKRTEVDCVLLHCNY